MHKENIIIGTIFIIVVLGIVILYQFKGNDNAYDLKIYFFNAGKADAIILSKDNHYMMIDTGEESLSEQILRYCEQNNITKLDYLIISHFDKDHVGSAASIIDNLEIGEVLQSNVPKESVYYTAYLEALSNKGITPITVSGNYEINFADLEVNVNGPETIYDSNESNNSSLIVSIKYNDNKFLFMGDAENDRLKDYLNIDNDTYNFLKVPYHGNYLKRLEKLLSTKNIEYAVITSSADEPEDEETTTMLNNYNVEYYLTRNGSITVLSDGTNIKIKQ